MAAIFNLNHHASYVNFHVGKSSSPFLVFSMSVSNLVVIALMLIVFGLAIWLRLPGAGRAGSAP